MTKNLKVFDEERLKTLEEEGKELDKDKGNAGNMLEARKDPFDKWVCTEFRIAFIHMQILNLRVQQTAAAINYVAEFVERLPESNEFAGLKKEFDEMKTQFQHQGKKIEDTLTPIKDALESAKEQSKRGNGVYG